MSRNQTIEIPTPAFTLEQLGQDYFSLRFTSMGTPCSIVFKTINDRRARDFSTQAIEWLRLFESKYSRFLDNSMISEINRQAGICPVSIDNELHKIFSLCDWFHWSTNGLFDPTMLPLIQLWDYRAAPKATPSASMIDQALSLMGWTKVEHNEHQAYLPEKGMAIDLGGIGKEYAVDAIFSIAIERGIDHFLLNFGQDLRASGQAPNDQPWLIGLERPDQPGLCWGAIALSDRAVTTSGNYLRKLVINGHEYGHILDPRTGWPVQNDCRAVSIIAPTCTEAGLLSTTSFIQGVDKGMQSINTAHSTEGFICTFSSIHYSQGAHAHVS